MTGFIKYMVHNHVAANILLLFIIMGGIYTGYNIPQEVFPDVEYNRINISVSYPGAGPSEVSTALCQPIEQAITEIDGLEEILCTANEERASLRADLKKGVDQQAVLQEIRNAVDSIKSFPDEVSDPQVSKQVRRVNLMDLVLYGEIPRTILFDYAYQIKDELLSIEGISYISISGDIPREILIEVNPDHLNQYNQTLNALAVRVKKASSDIPAGSVKVGASQILLRTNSKKASAQEIGEIVVDTLADGSVLTLNEIATIRESLQETDSMALFDGQPAVIFSIYQDKDSTPGQLSKIVTAKLAEYQNNLPDTLKFEVWSDRSEMFDDRLELLVRNAGIGLALVFLTLAFFMELRLAFWVMLGIPISFIGSLIFLPFAGVTIHMNSLFAFILVSGIVVDDAVVIGENIYRHIEMGKNKIDAAIDGCLEMAGPVTFAILTTLCAFAPMLFVEGRMGTFIYAIPTIVIAVLSISLIEALFILPAHLGHISNKPLLIILRPIELARRFFDRGLKWIINKPFTAVIRVTLEYRYSTVAAAIVFLSLSGGFIGGGVVPLQFFPSIDSDSINATLELPTGFPGDKTRKLIRDVEKTAIDIIEKIDLEAGNGKKSYDHIFTRVQARSRRSRTENTTIDIRVRFKKEEERNVNIRQFTMMWRKAIPKSPEILALNFRSRMIHFGDDIRITLSHRNPALLKKAVEDLKGQLLSFENVKDIVDSETGGSREFQFSLSDEAIALGITPTIFAESLRGAFQGIETHSITRENQDIDVVVLFPKLYRDNVNTLNEMKINTPQGKMIFLKDAALIKEGVEPAAIRRVNLQRVVEITAGIEEGIDNTDQLTDTINEVYLSKLGEMYPGTSIKMKGSHENRTKSMNSLWLGFGIALIGIFSLLAVFFRSYSQPVIVMLSIPFGIAGAVAGHYILGHPISFMSLFGLVGLTGVVVNDALILIDAINRHPEVRSNLFNALLGASRMRFRPIVITSITTFAGLGPILFEQSRQAQFLIPTAISLGIGILFATFVTLILVPALYFCLDDIKNLLSGGYEKPGLMKPFS
ncbi:MAG: efflux RND transporter permease subunit [SAR324 cluster bacterium]|nr:efflux RND transporter permease subunit [SAR324 cluster bacterium]